jgi:hypothetical protein
MRRSGHGGLVLVADRGKISGGMAIGCGTKIAVIAAQTNRSGHLPRMAAIHQGIKVSSGRTWKNWPAWLE